MNHVRSAPFHPQTQGKTKHAFNGDPRWTLPMPSRFVIAQDGTILYAAVNPDYTKRPEPEDMLPALRRAASVAA